MKTVTSILVVLMMAFALVSSSAAGGNVSAKDADNPGHVSTWTPYPCGVASPAYLDYTEAVALPCTERDRDPARVTPEPMSSPGF
jgi:hypothetical protein